jgi:hypothetical protein
MVLPTTVEAFNTCEPGAHALDPVAVGAAGVVRTDAVAADLTIEAQPVVVILDSA